MFNVKYCHGLLTLKQRHEPPPTKMLMNLTRL